MTVQTEKDIKQCVSQLPYSSRHRHSHFSDTLCTILIKLTQDSDAATWDGQFSVFILSSSYLTCLQHLIQLKISSSENSFLAFLDPELSWPCASPLFPAQLPLGPHCVAHVLTLGIRPHLFCNNTSTSAGELVTWSRDLTSQLCADDSQVHFSTQFSPRKTQCSTQRVSQT